MKDAGFDLTYTVPTDGVYGSYYAQGVIVKGCPQPNAAKLWIEHILSNDGRPRLPPGWRDPGALRRAAEAAGLVTARHLQEPARRRTVLAQIKFPSADQLAKANQVITDNWGTMVAGS